MFIFSLVENKKRLIVNNLHCTRSSTSLPYSPNDDKNAITKKYANIKEAIGASRDLTVYFLAPNSAVMRESIINSTKIADTPPLIIKCNGRRKVESYCLPLPEVLICCSPFP